MFSVEGADQELSTNIYYLPFSEIVLFSSSFSLYLSVSSLVLVSSFCRLPFPRDFTFTPPPSPPPLNLHSTIPLSCIFSVSDIYGIKYPGAPPLCGHFSTSPGVSGGPLATDSAIEYHRRSKQRPDSGRSDSWQPLMNSDNSCSGGQLSTISNSSPRTNITVNPSEVSAHHSWTPLLHLHQESVL